MLSILAAASNLVLYSHVLTTIAIPITQIVGGVAIGITFGIGLLWSGLFRQLLPVAAIALLVYAFLSAGDEEARIDAFGELLIDIILTAGDYIAFIIGIAAGAAIVWAATRLVKRRK